MLWICKHEHRGNANFIKNGRLPLNTGVEQSPKEMLPLFQNKQKQTKQNKHKTSKQKT